MASSNQPRLPMPGARGGRTTAARYGREYMRAIGARGGRTTAARYRDSWSLLGRLGAVARWYRTRLRAGRLWRVAWWPDRSTARRRRPLLLYFTEETTL